MQELPSADNSVVAQQVEARPSVVNLDVAPRVEESALVDNSFVAEQTKVEQPSVGRYAAAELVERRLLVVEVQIPVVQTVGTVAGTVAGIAATGMMATAR